MSWLERLKKKQMHPYMDATNATKPSQESKTGGFVGFVASIPAPIQKIEGDSPAANDPAPTPKAAAVDLDLIPQQGDKVSTTLALDPDRHCWPHSTAMNGREIDTFTARLGRFITKGVILTDGEALADKLVARDRESDDRRLCLECLHLTGYAGASWRCGNWQRAGVASTARDSGLPGDLVRTLQQCDGFKDQFNPVTR